MTRMPLRAPCGMTLTESVEGRLFTAIGGTTKVFGCLRQQWQLPADKRSEFDRLARQLGPPGYVVCGQIAASDQSVEVNEQRIPRERGETLIR